MTDHREAGSTGFSAADVALAERAVLCWLATADGAGAPSVSPKEIFVVRAPDEILIADIASPRSTRHIAAQSRVCVAAVDVFDQRGWQAFGTAQVVASSHDAYAELSAPLSALAGPAFPIRSVIRVTVDRVRPILAPSLWMYPDRDLAQSRAQTLARYGVQESEAAALSSPEHEGA